MTRSQLETEIEGIFRDCDKKGWDGYGAGPIFEKDKQRALAFGRSIPDALLKKVEISPEPVGGLAFEWFYDDDNFSCISLNPRAKKGVFQVIVHVKKEGEEDIYDADYKEAELSGLWADISVMA